MAGAARTGLSRWIVSEAYPLYFFVGGATAAFFGMIGRTISSDPDMRFWKDSRKHHFPDTEKDVAVGSSHYDHFIRRATRGKEPCIFPNAMVRSFYALSFASQ
eukprot:evm.model.scf_13EXC.5 EVM.evm.TU.scf_13EXC.5   scf_13EXC:102376-104220(-)